MVVEFIRVCLVHSRAPWGSAGSYGIVPSIPVSSGSRRVCSSAFGPFTCAVGVVVLVRERSVHSRSPWGSFWFFQYIPMRPRGRSVRSVQSHAPYGS